MGRLEGEVRTEGLKGRALREREREPSGAYVKNNKDLGAGVRVAINTTSVLS